MEKKHYYYLDFLRIIAAYTVVIRHLSTMGARHYNISSMDWMVDNIFASIGIFAVPIFFMVSGCVFLNPTKNITYTLLWQKYIKKFIIYFLIWSSIYTGFRTIMNYPFPFCKEAVKYFITATLSGENTYQFWFLFVLVGLYIITPFLRKIVYGKLLKIFLIISFIVSIVLPTIQIIPVIGNPIFDYFQKFEVYMPMGYVFYFALGYYLNTHVISKKNEKILCLASLLMIILTIFLTYIYTQQSNEFDETFHQKLLLNTCIMGIGVFCIAKSMEEKFKQSKFFGTFLSNATKYTLGVYAMHVLVLIVFQKLGILFVLPEILNIIILPIIIIFICYIVTNILYKLPPKIYRYLI